MKVSEEQRRELFERLRVHLDEETANLLLEVTLILQVDQHFQVLPQNKMHNYNAFYFLLNLIFY